ncbi:MAG: hypothetical protein HYW51_00160 [Candidatus Doudnabacteria bacterium]|nr:hypothetical protein [Candidatus Doudnabacteria bacterium]
MTEITDKREVKVKAVFTQDGNPINGKVIAFSRDGIAEAGNMPTTNLQGEAEWIFKVPDSIAQTKLKAETVDGVAFRETTVSVPVKVKATEDLLSYELHWLPRRLAPNRYSVHLIVKNDQNNSKAVKLRLRPVEAVRLNGTDYAAGSIIRDLDVPEGGMSWEFEVEEPRTEIDIFVEGLNKSYDLVLHGPKASAPAVAPGAGTIKHLIAEWEGGNPQLRFFWSWLPLFALLTVWFGSFLLPSLIAMSVASYWAISLFRGGEATAKRLNQRLEGIMGTNNRWWTVWVITCWLALLVAVLVTIWVPGTPEPLPSFVSRSEMTEAQQRASNLERFGYSGTDAEIEELRQSGLLEQAETETGSERPGLTQRTLNPVARWLLPDQSLLGWIKRLVTLALMWLGTFFYTFLAFADELQAWAEKKTERAQRSGSASWLAALARVLAGGSKRPPRRSGKGSEPTRGIWRWILGILAVDEVLELLGPISRGLRKLFGIGK